METGYFHPDRGYWQITGVVPQSVLSTYPSRTVVVPLKPYPTYEWNGTAWVEPTVNAVAILVEERLTLSCTPMQGILALGESNWQKVLDFRDGTGDWLAAGPAPWSQKVIIDGAQTWVRNSQNIQFFQYLLGFTDEEVDTLFRAAALIDA